jgi:hypothetical protein
VKQRQPLAYIAQRHTVAGRSRPGWNGIGDFDDRNTTASL